MEVLRRAQAVSRASRGAFDVTLGRLGARYRDIALLPGRRVQLRRRASLDLGGIAKGFAVDEAFDSLGRDLKLPAFLEPRRKEIEAVLPPLDSAEMRV